MREIVHRSERVSLASPAYQEAQAVARKVADTLKRQGFTASIAWDDEYNDTNTLGTLAVIKHS